MPINRIIAKNLSLLSDEIEREQKDETLGRKIVDLIDFVNKKGERIEMSSCVQ